MKRLINTFLIAILICAAVCWLASCDSYDLPTEDRYISVDGDINSIEIESDLGEVYVSTGDTFSIKLTHIVPQWFSYELTKGELSIEYDLPDNIKNVKDSNKHKIELTIPKNVNLKEMEVDITTGTLAISDFLANNIYIDNTAGDIECSTLTVNLLNINTASGDIDISNILADDIELSVASGKISISDINTDKLDINIASGNANLSNISADIFDTHAASGNISIENISAGSANLTTASGDIKADNITSLTKSNISTATGNIRISGNLLGEIHAASKRQGSISINLDEPIENYNIVGSVNCIKINGSPAIDITHPAAANTIYVKLLKDEA